MDCTHLHLLHARLFPLHFPADEKIGSASALARFLIIFWANLLLLARDAIIVLPVVEVERTGMKEG